MGRQRSALPWRPRNSAASRRAGVTRGQRSRVGIWNVYWAISSSSRYTSIACAGARVHSISVCLGPRIGGTTGGDADRKHAVQRYSMEAHVPEPRMRLLRRQRVQQHGHWKDQRQQAYVGSKGDHLHNRTNSR